MSIGSYKVSTRRVALRATTASALLLTTAFVADANANKQVVLEAIDGSVKLNGELVNFSDGIYIVETKIGVMTIDEASVTCSGPGCPVVDIELTMAAMPPVRLVAHDGSTEVVGELADFDGDAYTINTVLGPLTIAVADVECIGEACPEIVIYDPSFTISGGGHALTALLPDLLEGFAASRGLIYDPVVSDEGMTAIRLLNAQDGEIEADITFVNAAPSDAAAALDAQEAAIAIVDKPQGVDGRSYLIAHDAMVLTTHEDNPVRDLTPHQIAQIWSGEATTWEQFGGGDIPITVHMERKAGMPLPAAFEERVLHAAGLSAEKLGPIRVHNSPDAVVRAVQEDRRAIGLTSRVVVEDTSAQMVEIRKACGLMSAPTDFELKVESYPLARPVMAYLASNNPHPVAQDFITWTQSSEAQLRVSEAGFGGEKLQRAKMRDMGVAIIQTSIADEFDGAQFSSMLRELRDADRLSLTFRFESGSSNLDAESVGFVRDLAERLEANEFDGLEVLLVGFADSSGGAARNTELAGERAATVLDILRNELDPSLAQRFNLKALSFGEQMPIDCNDTAAGRSTNRRVEVWVRRSTI